MKNLYTYVHWKKGKVINTFSGPSKPKGQKLMKKGFVLCGVSTGFDLRGAFEYDKIKPNPATRTADL